MDSRKISLSFRRLARSSRVLQIGLLMASWLVGEWVARWTRLPVPGGIFGMVLVLALLASQHVSLCYLRRGANWFLSEMLLFFVPAVLTVLDHPELMGLLGVKVLGVILLGTVVVMIVTALTVEFSFGVMARFEEKNHGLE